MSLLVRFLLPYRKDRLFSLLRRHVLVLLYHFCKYLCATFLKKIFNCVCTYV